MLPYITVLISFFFSFFFSQAFSGQVVEHSAPSETTSTKVRKIRKDVMWKRKK